MSIKLSRGLVNDITCYLLSHVDEVSVHVAHTFGEFLRESNDKDEFNLDLLSTDEARTVVIDVLAEFEQRPFDVFEQYKIAVDLLFDRNSKLEERLEAQEVQLQQFKRDLDELKQPRKRARRADTPTDTTTTTTTTTTVLRGWGDGKRPDVLSALDSGTFNVEGYVNILEAICEKTGHVPNPLKKVFAQLDAEAKKEVIVTVTGSKKLMLYIGNHEYEWKDVPKQYLTRKQ